MKKSLILFSLLVLIGAGCASNPSASTIGTSHFGRVVDELTMENPIKGGWVRPHPGPFWWDQIETSQDVYDWSKVDETVKYWQERDQAILPTLWPFAQWDQARCHAKEAKVRHPFGSEEVWLWSICHVESYEEWVGKVVERYDGDGTEDMPDLKYPIAHWEIGHEPEPPGGEWIFFQRGPLAYEELYRIGFSSIKSADPNATVLLAGMAGMTPNSVTYWRDVLQANRQWEDVANIHSDEEAVDFHAAKYREFLDGLGFENRPFWVTEAIVGMKGEEWSDDERARQTVIGYAQAFANGAQKIFAPVALDAALGLVVETLNGFESVERLTETSIKFEFPKKKVIYVLWGDAKLPETVKGKVEVVRYDGTREKKNTADVIADVPMLVIAR